LRRRGSVLRDRDFEATTLGDATTLTLGAAAPDAVIDVLHERVLEAWLGDWTAGTYRTGAVDACTI
jgi:hypothetical protein